MRNFRFQACLILVSVAISSVLVVSFAPFTWTTRHVVYPHERSAVHVREISSAISSILEDFPDANGDVLLRELFSGNYFDGESIDPWGHEFRIERQAEVLGDGHGFVAISAGENGKFGDIDDVNSASMQWFTHYQVIVKTRENAQLLGWIFSISMLAYLLGWAICQ